MQAGLAVRPLAKSRDPAADDFGYNLLINGDFRVNQLSLGGPVVLGPGAYGHDQWKAGAAGCTYTLITLNGTSAINITAGSLVQVVHGASVKGGAYVLSWAGSAQGRPLNGSYGASPVAMPLLLAGANAFVEFGIGTLTSAKLERGRAPTPDSPRHISIEISLCKQYYQQLQCGYQGQVVNGTGYGGTVNFPVEMIAAPSMAFLVDATVSNFAGGTVAFTFIRPYAVDFGKLANGTGAGVFSSIVSASARL